MIRKRKEDGFTLIELMIVIAIIGILAVVLVPRMVGIKNGAKLTGTTTNISSVQAYCEANINAWESSDSTGASAKTAILNNFQSGSDKLINPLDPNKDAINSETSILANGSTDTGYAASPATNYAGEVVFDTSNITSTGIVIAGIDDKGKIMNTVTVKP